MCTVILYKCRDKPCSHSWMEIDTPCGPTKGFSNCHVFHSCRHHGSSISKLWHVKKVVGKKEFCPKHGLKGNYDYNRVRMVEKRQLRFGWWGDEHSERDDGTARVLLCSVM